MNSIKRIFYIVAFVLLIGCTVNHLLPVSWDAGACSGGFKSHIYNKYIDELASLYVDSHDEYKAVRVIKKPADYGVAWKGRNLYLGAVFDVIDNNDHQNTITVEFVGKRYWTERFSWKEQ